jgi:hypothetical protein
MFGKRCLQKLFALFGRKRRLRFVLLFSRGRKDPKTIDKTAIEDIHAIRGGPGKPGPLLSILHSCPLSEK